MHKQPMDIASRDALLELMRNRHSCRQYLPDDVDEETLQSILTDKFRDENENTCRMVHIALTSVERIENELQEVLEGISDALLPKPEPPKNLYGSIDF